MARPTKMTPELIERLEYLLTLGLSRERACIAIGISEDSLSRWCKKDAELSKLLERAEVAGEIEHLENVRAVARGERKGDFRASAWFLGRKYPAQWSERQPAEKPATDLPFPLATDIALPREQRRARIAELRAKMGKV